MPTRHALTAITAVALLTLGACGSDDTASSDPAAEPEAGGGDGITVIAEDIAFPEDTYQAAAGDVNVTYENEGSIEHTLLIDGVDGFKLDVPANGDVDEGSVKLDPGSYTIYCDVAGHREGGMEATLEVS